MVSAGILAEADMSLHAWSKSFKKSVMLLLPRIIIGFAFPGMASVIEVEWHMSSA